ncbi:LTA synthase family protein [Candidatus Avelusimicrobium stercoris]|uniref:LTA synthase family protein n=1 Tax=Candidatus Avelusimicrobium stercoris TaxID=1947924 RepID=UPI003D0EFB5B
MIQKTDFRLKWSFFTVLAAALLFTVARAALFLLNRDFFSALSGAEIFSAFLNGLRFDFSVIALFMGPVLFLLNLPVRGRGWVKFWVGVLLAELILAAGFLIGDLIYFPKVNRHIAEEIVQVANDWGYVLKYMLTQVWLPLIMLLGGFAWAVRAVCRYTDKHFQANRFSKIRTGEILFLIVLLTFLGIRGHIGRGKSLGVADVYNYAASPAGAALTLNGAFTAYQVGRKGAMEISNAFPADKALELTQKRFVAADETVPDENYPLMRQAQPDDKPLAKDYNVMIVLLEGWHPYYVDGLSGQNFGATPVFDDILKNGVNFTNAYAAGLRSIFGFAAVFAGVPLVPGLPMFGYGLELTSFSPMPKHFSQAGYYTFFAQTSHRDSYRLCALASYLGVKDSYGWENIPELLKYKDRAPFGYDYDALMFAADKIKNRQEKNFMGMVFTGITHEPFASTLPQFDKYPYDSWEHGFLNTLSFADWSIGEFLKRAKEDGWFDNTIFVFVADHTSGGPADDSLKNRFRIPLVIYAPKLFKGREAKQIVSQLDLIPTLYRLTGLTPAYTAFGRDMFDTSLERVALVSEGVNIGLITLDGEMRHSGGKILSATPGMDTKKAEETLLSLDKAAYTLLKENRWYKPQTGEANQ